MQLPEADLIRIVEATRVITSTLRLSELLSSVIRLAGEVVKAEAASLLLLDPKTDELYFDVALGEKGGALQQIRLKKGEGIAGWVALEDKPAVVNDVAKDPRWTQKADKTTQFITRSILAVPMKVQDKMVGVIEAINRADGQPFSELDVKILEMFSAQAAVAIQNARLFESIRQEKEKMSTILGQMVEGAVLLDATGQVALMNPAAGKFLELQGDGHTSWVTLEERFDIKPAWSDIPAIGGAGGIEIQRKAQPPLILEGVITQVCDDRGRVAGYLIVFTDVTEARRESQLKKNFLAMVSHKLKTPLVAIRGFTPMLLENPAELNSFQKTAIETIDRNSLLLQSLVEKLMWFSTLEGDTIDLTPKAYAVNDVIDSAMADLAPFLRTHQAQIIRDPSLNEVPAVLVDKIWIKEVIRNLIENAVKFNTKPDRSVRMGARVQGEEVLITVTDNGPGIPPEEFEKIFNKFYQIEGSFTGQVQGMGLGLALVKRVVEAHGGQATVESHLGQGSTFTVLLRTA